MEAHPVLPLVAPAAWFGGRMCVSARASAVLRTPSSPLREAYHVAGYIYIVCAFIAAPLGVYIQHANEPLGFARSFTIETAFQGGLWMATTAIALAFILKGKVQKHRQWMTRSFGTGPLIFLEVRVIGGITGWENLGPHANEIIVWACTLSSIFIADLVLEAEELYRSRPRRAAVRKDAAVADGAMEVST
jgi:hypothetical protein